MFKRFLTIIVALACVMHASAQQKTPMLKFGSDGDFKILQVSNCTDNSGAVSQATAGFISRLMEIEKPQLVVFTIGRQGMGSAAKASHSLKELCGETPYAVVSRDMQPAALPVMSSGGTSPIQVIYLMGEDVSFDLIAWYRQQSRKFTTNNSGTPLPAVAFLTKPLPEYAEAYDEYGSQKMLKKLISHTGNKGGDITCQENNSGLFTSMHECGDVRGIFCGYDDSNDFALVWKNIMLAYCRNTNSESMSEPGARVVVLKETDETFNTYIRNDNNEVVDRCTFPQNFTVTK